MDHGHRHCSSSISPPSHGATATERKSILFIYGFVVTYFYYGWLSAGDPPTPYYATTHHADDISPTMAATDTIILL